MLIKLAHWIYPKSRGVLFRFPFFSGIMIMDLAIHRVQQRVLWKFPKTWGARVLFWLTEGAFAPGVSQKRGARIANDSVVLLS